MRRNSTLIVEGSRRSVYSIWGSIVHDPLLTQGESLASRFNRKSMFRWFSLWHTPLVNKAPAAAFDTAKLSGPQSYLICAMIDDRTRLMSVDWTHDFDSFWRDRVVSHESMFRVLYEPNTTLPYKLLFGDSSRDTEAKLQAQSSLHELKATLKWAEETEKRYSAIAGARFKMQREVFDALEREKILSGCAEMMESFRKIVPSEFQRKACSELDTHFGNLRHWVWDCPNAKRYFPRALN